jgi:hypothetical protein
MLVRYPRVFPPYKSQSTRKSALRHDFSLSYLLLDRFGGFGGVEADFVRSGGFDGLSAAGDPSSCG